MKHKMLFSFILALLLLPLVNSCDPDACKIGTSVGTGVCAAAAGVGGVVTAASCTVGAFLSFGISCLAAGLGFAAAGGACAGVGGVVGNACDSCASGDAPDYAKNFQEISDKLDGTEQNFQEIFKKLDGTEHKFKEIFNKLDGTEQNLQEIMNKLDGFELNFQEFVDKTDLNFQKIANKLDGIERTQLENHLKQEGWFQQLVENDKNIILGQVENLKKIANKLDGIEQNQVENQLKQEGWFQQLVENDKNIIRSQVENFKKIVNKLDGIEQNQVENHLKQEAWFQQLVENDKNIIIRQAKMIALQQTAVGQLDQLINTTETLGNKIEHSEIVTLYGQDIKHVRNVRRKFKRLTRGTSGIIVNDYRSKTFRDAALHPVFGSETLINNIFLMLIGGHIMKKESIYETPGGKYCNPEVHKYFLNVLVESLTMHATGLAMDGYTLSPQLTKKFNEEIIKATSAFVQHCDCPPGLKKANRGQVSTLLHQLSRDSQNQTQNMIRNRGQVAAMENNVMRLKMFLIFSVQNIEPNENAESILEKHSVEDIELVVDSVMTEKEGDLVLHDSADICVDKERNKVKTCVDSFVTGCVPPQTLENGRFLCLEDDITCHVVCNPGYYLEITDMAGLSALKAQRFMKCLGSTWTPLPTTFQCTLDCDYGANAQNPACAVIHGGWSSYGQCSRTCKTNAVQTRTCTNPEPKYGGNFCAGSSSRSCNQNINCPIHGGWSSYGQCSRTCKTNAVRMRTCTNPEPKYGGNFCAGSSSRSCNQNINCRVPTCRGGATTLSTSPRLDMVLCKDYTQKTCEKDFESLCPAGWNLCHPKQFNNRNQGWDYNYKDANAGRPLGVIYCNGVLGGAGHYGIHSNPVLSTDQPPDCGWWHSSRPGCEGWAGRGYDCNDQDDSALCCAPTSTCGDGRVQQEEDCDDGNTSNLDNCMNSCTWRKPDDHGFSGC